MGNKQNPLFTRMMVAGGLLFSTMALQSASRQVQPKTPASAGSKPSASILTIPVKGLRVEHASMAEALQNLRHSDISHVVIGFERIPHRKGGTGGPITLMLKDTTLGQAVKRFCEADPRYEYQVIEGYMIKASLSGSMIEVRPKGALKDPNDLLNIRIRKYRVDARTNGAIEAIEHISEDAPELSEFLRRKHEEWVRKTGRQPGGFPGSIMSGNMPPPPFILELHNVTVRQILDAISLKSIQRFKEGKNYGPVGWQYEFIIQKDAPSGLGGTPRWEVF